MRTTWSAALKPTVSGIATDAMLFSQYGARLVHQYRVYDDYMPHHSLPGTFMSRLSDFTHRACAEARLVAKCGRDSSTESVLSPVRPALMPFGLAHCTPDHAPDHGPEGCERRDICTPTARHASSCSDVPVAARACIPNTGSCVSGPEGYACCDIYHVT